MTISKGESVKVFLMCRGGSQIEVAEVGGHPEHILKQLRQNFNTACGYRRTGHSVCFGQDQKLNRMFLPHTDYTVSLYTRSALHVQTHLRNQLREWSVRFNPLSDL
jgi:hypothetical protein